MSTRHLKHLSLVLLFIGSLSRPGWGCTIIVHPITGFDLSEYIFIGEVVDIVGPIQPKYVVGEAWGLAIRVEAEVFLPRKSRSNYEVFRFNRESDCSLEGESMKELLKAYPIGSKVRVVAREFVAPKSMDGSIRLTSTNLGIVPNDYKAGDWLSREYNYKTYDRSDYSLVDFELRKDLLRLSKSKSEKRSVAILERLVYYPPLILDYSAIVDNHLRNSRVAGILKKKREEWTRKLRLYG